MDITAMEVDAVVAGLSPLHDHAFASAFRTRASGGDPHDAWGLLANVFDMHLRPADPEQPFGPLMVMDGRRSMIPSDITDNQVGTLQLLLQGVTNDAVLCRLGDVLWVARRDGRAGAKAVPAYIAKGILLEDPDMWPPCMECYERAVRLARSLGRASPLLTAALQHLSDRVAHYNGEDPLFFTSSALALLEEFRFGDPSVLGGYAVTSARRRDLAGNPFAARSYWDLAAKFLVRAGQPAEAEQAQIAAAQTWVAEADQTEASGNHGAAQSHIENAIQVYRAIPSCKHLLPPLHRRLNAAGAEALKLMRRISSDPVDIEPMVRAAQASVQGLPTADAIYSLACAAPTIDPVKLRSQVMEMAQKAPLSSMMASVMFDREGRAVHKSPGLFTDDPDEHEQAIEAQVSRHADLHRHLTVSATLLPAFLALLGEHTIEEADISPLVQGSILIPDGREGLFVLGLAAGFRRDMVTAMHILVPQLEHALRVLLRDAGTITASIDREGIQSEWPLGRLLSPSVIRPVLPETLVFELRSLLIFKGSSNIRNRLCHGLLDSDDFSTANVFYTWWLLLKIVLHGTPGFQAWIDERVRNQSQHEEVDALTAAPDAAPVTVLTP